MDENELIRRSKEGDTESFSQLVLTYERRMVNYAFRMLRDVSDAEDAAQEAFLRAYRKLDSFHGDAAFSTWLYTILNNICLDMLRKRKRTGEQNQVSLNQSSADSDEYEIQIEDASPGPYDSYRKKAAMKALEEAIAQLSDEHRAVIVMRDINGLEYDEIARITKTTLGTVKSRISRARIALRKILEKDRELFT